MFNNKIENRSIHPAAKCQCLDFIEMAHRDRLYPLIYCHMERSGLHDITLLSEAVRLSGGYVPESLSCYDFKHGAFINRRLEDDRIIIAGNHILGGGLERDLSIGPQLKIVTS